MAGTRSGYGVTLALALGPAIALGLARFGYSLLLAPMRVSLHWSFTIAGALSTANSAGYLAGAVLAGPLTRRWGARKAFVLATCLSALLLLATAASRRSAALLSVYSAGIGAGIVMSGAGVPWLLAVASPAGWRLGWVLLGGLAALGCVIAVPAALSCGEPPVPAGPGGRWPAARLAPLLACYVLFGVGYIGYFTFIVAWLQGRGASPG